jgi:hypothetical protein
LLAALSFVLACSDGDDGGDTDAIGPASTTGDDVDEDDDEEPSPKLDLPPLTDIEVTVDYDGEPMGAVGIGVFPTCPVDGAPVSFRRVTDPVFPLQTTLVNVEDGEYCVYAFVDLPPENPNLPGPEDPQGDVQGIVVEAGAVVSAAVTILDPV